MTDLSVLPELAVEQFLGQGLYCSEAILKVYNDALGIGLNDAGLRMATGFGAGLGGAKCSCGSLTGAVLVASALQGRTSPQETETQVFETVSQLHDRFKARFKAICCRSLTRGVEWGSPEHGPFCAQYVRGAAEILNELLTEHGPKATEGTGA